MSKKLIGILLLSTLISVSVAQPNEAQTKKSKYNCVERNGNPTTLVETERGIIELIVWKSDFFQNSGWNPLKRCQEVTTRFQEFSEAGELKYVTTGQINGSNVICVANLSNPKENVCKNNGLLITLEPNDNPQQVKNDLFNVNDRLRLGGITRGCPKDSSFYTKPVLDLEIFLNCVPTIQATSNNFNNPIKPQPKPIPAQNQKPNNDIKEIDPLFW